MRTIEGPQLEETGEGRRGSEAMGRLRGSRRHHVAGSAMGKPSAIRKRVLIVDAEHGKWEDLKGWLQTEGYPVEHVDDGWQAIEKLRDGRFAVAIIALDLSPGNSLALSSWHLARICKVLDPGIATLLVGRGYGQDLQALQMEQLRETISQLL